jgi:iron complex transport system ATP-binding protein
MNREAGGPLNAVEARAVRVWLGGVPILHGVDMSVALGEWVTIIGPNGAGKSTLLRAIGGLFPFGHARGGGGRAAGEIRLHGAPIRDLPRRQLARLVATVPQNPEVPPGMTVLDYVLLGRTPYIRPLGRESTIDLAAVRAVLARLDLTELADRPLETLSGGERQRAFLARALAQGAGSGDADEPDQKQILLLDEPTSALDIGHQQEVLELVDELRRDGRLTVVATMHDLSIAGEYADRLVLLAKGRVVSCGTPTEVLTEATLSTHYGARVRVVTGEHGPLIVPVRSSAPR